MESSIAAYQEELRVIAARLHDLTHRLASHVDTERVLEQRALHGSASAPFDGFQTIDFDLDWPGAPILLDPSPYRLIITG